MKCTELLSKGFAIATIAVLGAGTAYAQNADIHAQLDATVLDQSVDADTSASLDADTSTDDTVVQTSADSGATFNLSRDDAAVDSASEGNTSAATVSTQGDLEAYAATAIRDTDAIEGVDMTGEALQVRFGESVRLFGFIPFTMTSRVEVASDGTVSVKRPWYSFLVAGASTEVTSEMETNIRNAIAAEGGFTTRAQAQVLGEVAAALGARAYASADATLGESVNAEIDAALESMTNPGEEETMSSEGGSADVAPQ